MLLALDFGEIQYQISEHNAVSTQISEHNAVSTRFW
jgi:hypothetical protein